MSIAKLLAASEADAHGAFFTEAELHRMAEEIALMEAVIDAADNGTLTPLIAAFRNLDTYRKENQ